MEQQNNLNSIVLNQLFKISRSDESIRKYLIDCSSTPIKKATRQSGLNIKV